MPTLPTPTPLPPPHPAAEKLKKGHDVFEQGLDQECFREFMLEVMVRMEKEEGTWFQRTFPDLYYTRAFHR